jgi:hypothetical protein
MRRAVVTTALLSFRHAEIGRVFDGAARLAILSNRSRQPVRP